MIGAWPVASEAVAGLPEDLDESTTSPLPIFLRSRSADFVYLLIASPLDVTASGVESLYPYAVGEEAIGAIDAGEIVTMPPERVFLGSHPYRTLASDDPPEVLFEPRLTVPYSFEARIPLPASGTGLGAGAIGRIRAANGDRELDRFLAWAWEHRALQLLIGGTVNPGRWNEEVLPLDEYWPMPLQCAGIESDGQEGFEIIVADASLEIYDTLAREEYGGTGGLDGDANLAGKKKPLCLGIVRNAEAVPVDPAALVYQVHDGSIEAVISVRDKGVDLTPDGDISGLGLASVYDWVDVSGHFVTDLSRGIFRLGAKPQGGRVTCDVQGYNSGGYIDSTPEIVQALAVVFGGFPAERIDQRAFFLHFTATGPIGVYTGLDDPRTLGLIGELLAGASGWVSFTRDGLLTIREHKAPEIEVAVDSASGEEVLSASSEPTGAPIWRVSVGYLRSWVVQTGDDLAAGVSEANRAVYGSQLRVATVTNSVARGAYQDAYELRIDSFFDEESDAREIAEQTIRRHSLRRRMHKVRVADWVFQRAPGDVISIQSDRAGLQTPKNVVVISVAENAPEKAVDMELWG